LLGGSFPPRGYTELGWSPASKLERKSREGKGAQEKNAENDRRCAGRRAPAAAAARRRAFVECLCRVLLIGLNVDFALVILKRHEFGSKRWAGIELLLEIAVD
jgi:hypothetical protein